MRVRSQNLLSSFVRIAVAANIFTVVSLSWGAQNNISWAKNLENTRNLLDKSNSNRLPNQFLFLDLQNHWTRPFVEGLLLQPDLSAVLVDSAAINNFQPDRPITRAELAKFLDVAFANRNVAKITTRLNEPATKVETLVAIAREIDLSKPAIKAPQAYLLSMYRDALQVPDYAIPAIATLTQQGLVTNYSDPRILAPKDTISKGELSVMLYQALAYQKKLPKIQSLYTINPDRPLLDANVMKVTRLEVSISRRNVTAFHGEIPLKTYPVAVGKAGWGTPVGTHRVLQTIEYPAWQNPFTGDVIASKDPENPLGDRWIGFWTDGKDWSGFHGTPNRASVGTASSHGCIRMYNEDVRELFSQVTLGTIVKVSP